MMRLFTYGFCCLFLFFSVLTAPSSYTAEPDTYISWTQGRPAESVPLLLERAQSENSWQSWYDCGLAAAEAEQAGLATACLLRSHHLAPHQSLPLEALAMLATDVPNAWSGLLGPFAQLGSGVMAILLASMLGLSLGYGILGRRGRFPSLGLALLCALLVLPALVLRQLDAQRQLAATLQDTELVNASGEVIVSLPAGQVVHRTEGTAWAGRTPVRLADGTRGFIASSRLAIAEDPSSIREP